MNPCTESLPTHEQVLEASSRLAGLVLNTPVLNSAALDRLADAQLYFKCENLQAGGAFKLRGASNAVELLDRATCRGVCTHSSGNHGAALALAASRRGLDCTVVVPDGASARKLQNMQAHGARLVRCAASQAAREAGMRRVMAETGACSIPPYDHRHVIAGQGTAALELMQSIPDLQALLAPVGGGGLLAGCALAANGALDVYGAEPQGADDAARSFQQRRRVTDQLPDTLCDGLRATIGELTFAVIQDAVRDILTVKDSEVVIAMRLIWDELKLVVEPSAAIGLAVVLAHPDEFRGKRIGLILSGGNQDLDALPW